MSSAKPSRTLGHEWVEIPSGYACLGSDERDAFASQNEKPLREVYIPTFLISRHPTTESQMAAFYADTGQPDPRPHRRQTAAPEAFGTLPATFISWDLAAAYCSWLSQKTGLLVGLPTEAEWEKAARGGDDRIWPWGDVFDPALCCCTESQTPPGRLCSVHEFPGGASPYGVMHMAGCVWEWCLDFHHYGDHATADAHAPINLTPARQRVVKGGSAFCTKEIVRPACRDWTNLVNQGGSDDGFRVIVRID